MRVVYYTYPSYIDPALPFVQEMSRRVELHLFLELPAQIWSVALFDVPEMTLPAGVMPAAQAAEVLRASLGEHMQAYWERAATVNLVVHDCPKSIHPRTWSISYQTAKFIRSLKPDLVHYDDISLRTAWGVRRLGRIPHIMGIHDPEPHSFEDDWRIKVKRWLAFAGSRKFILHNEALRDTFRVRYRLPASRLSTIPLGVYDIYRAWIEEPVAEDGKTVLFFGRVGPYKGLDLLYEAAHGVAEKVAGVRFVVAGRPVPGYTPPSPPQLPNNCQVEVIDRYIHNVELARLFQQAAMVVCPYRDATQSGVVLTAYGFDRPVIATEVGGLPEYVKDGFSGYIVPPGNAQALAERIVTLLQNPSLRAQMRVNIRHLATTSLSWSSIADQTLEVYQEVLGKKEPA